METQATTAEEHMGVETPLQAIEAVESVPAAQQSEAEAAVPMAVDEGVDHSVAEPTTSEEMQAAKPEATKKPAGKKGKPVKAATPAARKRSSAKVPSGRKTYDVSMAKRENARTKAGKNTPAKTVTVTKTLSFSASKAIDRKKTANKAQFKRGFTYKPYTGPLPPFSNSLFAPKEIQMMDASSRQQLPGGISTPAHKKRQFLLKSTGKGGGGGKENVNVNTPVDKPVQKRARASSKSTAGRVSVMDKTTESFAAKNQSERRARFASEAKNKALRSRQVARMPAPKAVK